MCPWERSASGLGVLPQAGPHRGIQLASQASGSRGPSGGVSSTFAKPQHLHQPIHYLQGSPFQLRKGPGRKEAWVLGPFDRRRSRFCFWAFRLPGPLPAKPLASTPPAPAGGPRRLHVPGELLTPRPTPALRPGPRVPALRRRLTGPRVREGGAEALSQLHGVRRARQLSAAAPGAETALQDDRGQRAETRGGPGPPAGQGGGQRGGRAAAGAHPAPARTRFAAAWGWRAEPSRAEQSGARRGRSFPRMGLTGKHGSSLFLEE